MDQKTVYQTDRSGWLIGTSVADESPLEPGVFHIPAGAIEVAPPEEWTADKWPRWSGNAWTLAKRPTVNTTAEKLAAFLAANPDVAAMIENATA